MKKFLSIALTLCLCLCSVLALIACNGKSGKIEEVENQAVDTKEISNEETEEITDAPTEKITEPQDTTLVIDGIRFNNALKERLNSAKTYGEICEILGRDGTLVECPDVAYSFVTEEANYCPIIVKFRTTDSGTFVCEDVAITSEGVGFDLSNADQVMLQQITEGKTFQELTDICGYKSAYLYGGAIVYDWSFGENIIIRVHFYHRLEKDKLNTEVMYIDFWDCEDTRTPLETFRANLEVGQSVAELNEILGVKGSIGDPLHCTWRFEDGTRFRISCYMDLSDKSLPQEEKVRFAGSALIILSQ